MQTTAQWARQEFSDTSLGDGRRRRRAIEMATTIAKHPRGTITQVFQKPAQRQAAYDFVENPHVDVGQLRHSFGRAAARRVRGEPYAIVPVDDSFLVLIRGSGRDPHNEKGLGHVGTSVQQARGLKATTALMLDARGVPAGLGSQRIFARGLQPHGRTDSQRHRATTAELEIGRWCEVMDDVIDHCKAEARGVRPWFQLDRAGDAWRVFEHLDQKDALFTIRALFDRRTSPTMRTKGWQKRTSKLSRARLRREPVAGRMTIAVPGSPKRKARTAQLSVRFCPMIIQAKVWKKNAPLLFPAYGVSVRETRTTPRGEEPIDWMLWTNYPVNSFEDAKVVIANYALRWRIEDFHRTWKGGGCKVEDSQLRSVDALCRWATLLATVAVRIERLKHLSRTQGDLPALAELSALEVEAIVLLKTDEKKKTETIHSNPTMREAVRWLADLGGYVGSKSSGPPGATVIRRGLERVLPVAQALAVMRRLGK